LKLRKFAHDHRFVAQPHVTGAVRKIETITAMRIKPDEPATTTRMPRSSPANLWAAAPG